MQVEILKYELSARAEYTDTREGVELPLLKGTYFSTKKAYAAMLKFRFKLEKQLVIPYKSIRFVITCRSNGISTVKVYEYVPRKSIEILRDYIEIEHQVRKEYNLPKLRAIVRESPSP